MIPHSTRHASADDGHRKGVLLLIVLSMLTLFMMLGATYLVVATRARATARAFARLTGEPGTADFAEGARLVDEAFLVVARGATNPRCVEPLRTGDDLLGDKYGLSVPGTIPPDTFFAGRLTDATADGPMLIRLTLDRSSMPAVSPAALGGRVITLTLPGLTWSTRIVRAFGSASGVTDLVVSGIPRSQATVSAAAIASGAQQAPFPAVHFVINGREFAGDFDNQQIQPPPTNEPYDGFDDKNPFLAHIVPIDKDGNSFDLAAPDRLGDVGSSRCERASFQPIGKKGADAEVDNDADGVNDSFWIDLGLPMSRDERGQWCRPRGAVLVLDLDGRLNANVHGSLFETELLEDMAAQQLAWPTSGSGLPTGMDAAAFKRIPVGSGYGPAEVRLGDLLVAGSGTDANILSKAGVELRALLTGSTAAFQSPVGNDAKRLVPEIGLLAGERRYGASDVPGQGEDDPLAAIQVEQRAPHAQKDGQQPLRPAALPDDWAARWSQQDPGLYGSPSDLSGRMRVFVDSGTNQLVSQLRYVKPVRQTASGWTKDAGESPYRIRPGRDTASDRLFGANEFERIARIYDWDAPRLPPRLAALLGPYAERLRLLIGTESWDTTAIVGHPRTHIEEQLAQFDPAKLHEVIAPEILGGRRLDLNRPVNSEQERQRLCRDLYTLLWIISADDDAADHEDPGDRPEEMFRAMAQWAANVVDFRDADSTMTRFEFDRDPRDGWSPSPQDVVYGVERPDVLITEALAWRQTAGIGGGGGNGGGGDQGGVYVVLHHPWVAKAMDGDAMLPKRRGGNEMAGRPAPDDPDAVDPRLDLPARENAVALDRRAADDPQSPIWQLRIDDNGPIVRFDRPTSARTGKADAWSDAPEATARKLGAGEWTVVWGETATPNGGQVTRDAKLPQLHVDRGVPLQPPATKPEIDIILERLADPTKPFDETTNPYREVDRVKKLPVVNRTIDNPLDGAPREAYQKRSRAVDGTPSVAFWPQRWTSSPKQPTDRQAGIEISKLEREPRSTIAWFPWLNRPYVSQVELALVPPWPADKILTTEPQTDDVTDFLDLAKTPNRMLEALGVAVGLQAANQREHLVRDLLQVTIVPSRFAGQATTIDDDRRQAIAAAKTGLDLLPINQFSTYREPGRVNVNTITDPRVWEAAVLRGRWPRDVKPTPEPSQLDWAKTTFGGFVAAAGASGSTAKPAETILDLLGLEQGAKALLHDQDEPGPDPKDNPHFAFLTASRLANVGTIRSHVFAVWVTVGYFECDANGNFVLGIDGSPRELGSDTGRVRRHRGFYVFDRSIPVAYETGRDHNVRDAILLRRIIQ